MTVGYPLMGKVQNELANGGVLIHDTLYAAEVTFVVDVQTEKAEHIYRTVQDLTADQFQWELAGEAPPAGACGAALMKICWRLSCDIV